MTTHVFIHLAVADLGQSLAFVSGLGFRQNVQWTDDTAVCFELNTTTYVLLMPMDRVTPVTQNTVYLALDSRDAVDQVLATALALGATAVAAPQQRGYCYIRCFRDHDTHCWELSCYHPVDDG